MAVSRRLRYEILRRDNHACRYCGATAPDVKLTVDHVLPVALGGRDDADNLVTACQDCNAGKSSSSPDAPIVVGVTDDALRWAAAVREAAERIAADQEAADTYCNAIESFITGYTLNLFGLPEDWRATIARFHALELHEHVVMDAFYKAHSKLESSTDEDVWRYFCGICWRTLDERQQLAREIYAAEPG